jgi:twinkle protein
VQLVRDIDLSGFMQDTETHKVRPAADFLDATIERFYGERRTGARMPWVPLHGKFDLRAGETTVWAGVNGTGKTQLVLQVVQSLLRQESPVFVASFELTPDRTMQRMCRHAAGGDQPSIEFIRAFHRWTDARLWLFDHQGGFSGQKMLAVVRWVRANLPVKHVVIDSLMKLDIGPDDYSAQKTLINRLHSLSMELGLHIHLIAHARKSERETDRIDKFAIKGTSEIADQVDNIVLVNRNVAKERKLEEWEQEHRDFANPSADMQDVLKQWDAGLRVAKQRHGEWEGAVPLWLDRRAQGFVSLRGDAVHVLPLKLPPREPGSDG